MKMKICLGIIAVSTLIGAAPANAIGLSLDLRDRAYYTRGPEYYVGTRHYFWIPGHVDRRGHWRRGHYALK